MREEAKRLGWIDADDLEKELELAGIIPDDITLEEARKERLADK